jgi:hypothetical protein
MNHNLKTFDNQSILEACKNAVEEKLAWGDSASWQTQDFERLSDRIFEETDFRLSASTLKRLWGKVQYNSAPNLTTLDALAVFAGYPDWRSFAALQEKQLSTPTQQQPIPAEMPRSKKRSFKPAMIFLLIVVSCLLIGFAFVNQSSHKLLFRNIQFSSRPVTTGVPNTVVFEYDATDSNADSVFIQQSWDERRRFRVQKDQHVFTSTYYLPGYYRAKLILNDSIVKEHDLLIESDGWTGAIPGQQSPLYLKQSALQQKDGIGISVKQLEELRVDTRNTPLFILSNVNRKTAVNSAGFMFNVQVQNTYQFGNAVCRKTQVLIHGTNGVIIIPLCEKGCVGEINLMIGSQTISGSTNDLSGFGVDFNKPVQVNCEVKEKKIRININDQTVFNGNFREDIGMIVGTRIQFEGTGEIKNLQLKPAL